MDITRRRALAAAALVAAGVPASSAFGQSAPFEAKGPIRFIVPYPAGGATDLLARSVAQKLAENWHATVLVDNRPGAAGTIGAQQVLRAAPDGQTVLFSIVALVQQITLMQLPYDPLKDFTPLTRVAISPSVLAVPKESPANSAKEFVALVKADPGKYNYGTYGAGTSSHIQGSLLNLLGQLDMVHVPYAGGAALLNAMLGNQVTAAFLDVGSSRPFLPKLKLLGVTGTKRLSWLADVPTMKEQGFANYEPMGWFGMLLHAGTPRAIVDAYSTEVRKILATDEIRERIESMGLVPVIDTPEEMSKVLVHDAGVYASIIKQAGIKLN